MTIDRFPPHYRARHEPRILVTGFGPFPGVPFNASAALVDELSRQVPLRGPSASIRTALLATEWRDGPLHVASLLEAFKPDAVLHFGVSSRARSLQIETRAFNATRGRDDHSGRRPGGHYVRRGSPPVLPARIPAPLLLWRLKLAGIPATVSVNAGRYLCNATFYNSLWQTRNWPRSPVVGFIHIPAFDPADLETSEADGQPSRWSMVQTGARIILDTVARFLQTERRSARPAEGNRLRTGKVLGGHRHDNRPSRISDRNKRHGRRRGVARR